MRGYDKTGRLDYTKDAEVWEAGWGCTGCHIEHLTNGPPTNSQLDLNRLTRVALLTKVASDVVATATGGYDPRDPTTFVRLLIHSGPIGGEKPSGGGSEPRVVQHPSEWAARRAAEREAGMGKHGIREALPDEPLRPGSQAPTGDPGVRTQIRSPRTGRTVHHDPYGHKSGNIPPHYGVEGPGVQGTTHHTYPTTHDPRSNR